MASYSIYGVTHQFNKSSHSWHRKLRTTIFRKHEPPFQISSRAQVRCIISLDIIYVRAAPRLDNSLHPRSSPDLLQRLMMQFFVTVIRNITPYMADLKTIYLRIKAALGTNPASFSVIPKSVLSYVFLGKVVENEFLLERMCDLEKCGLHGERLHDPSCRCL
jgi:hypothetical protein